MPAVLVETGFLTHQEEEQFMRSEQGQNKLSLSIAEAIEQYHHQNNP
jgi:N-acetylmuramoyl-L-alanine amidase